MERAVGYEGSTRSGWADWFVDDRDRTETLEEAALGCRGVLCVCVCVCVCVLCVLCVCVVCVCVCVHTLRDRGP